MERINQLLQMHQEDPEDLFVIYALAKEMEYTGNKIAALEYYKNIRNKNEDYIGLYYHLGKLLESLDQQEEALEVYDEGIAIAEKIKDKHALQELVNARTNLTMEM